MEHKILFANCNRENGPTFLVFPLFLGIFQWDELTKHVPVTAQLEILEMLTKWKVPITINFALIGYSTPPPLKFMIDGIQKPKISSKFTKHAARYNEFSSNSFNNVILLSFQVTYDNGQRPKG